MSEILDHDCDGRELRAGDRIRFVSEFPGNTPSPLGKEGNVTGRYDTGLDTDIPDPATGDTFWGMGYQMRLINSGRELFDKCAREADKMPSEDKVLASMPWMPSEYDGCFEK